MSFVGLQSQKLLNENLEVYPNPANDIMFLKSEVIKEGGKFSLRIINSIVQLIREEEIGFKQNETYLKTVELSAGIYFLFLQNNKQVKAIKLFVVNH